jgi:aldehyde dehydrogenase (NAD+)
MKNGNSIEKVSHEMDRPSVKDLALDFGKAWEYAPSPEATDHVKLQSRYELFVGGGRPEEREVLRHGEPEHRGDPRRGGRGHLRGRRPRGARGPKGLRWRVARMRPEERRKYLYRIARRIQERARELAVLETLDGGKPIKESRDVDIPLAPRTSSTTRAGPTSSTTRSRAHAAAARRLRPDHPVELPAAHGRVEARAGARVRQHGGAEARRDHAAHRAAPREIFDEAAAQGRRQHRHRRRRHRRGARRHPGVDKVAFTGSTEVGKKHPARRRGQRSKRLTLELGGKAAHIVFEDARIDQAIEGIVAASTSTRATCAAPARASRAGERPRRVVEKLAGAWRRSASATRSTRTPTSARSTRAQLEKIRELVRERAPRGRRRCTGCALPKKGFWFPPTFFTGVSQSHRIAREEIFGPVLSGDDVPHARRSGREGQQHRLRPVGRHLDRQGRQDLPHGAEAEGRRRLEQHLQQVRPGEPVRRLTRSRGFGREGGHPRTARPTKSRRWSRRTTP